MIVESGTYIFSTEANDTVEIPDNVTDLPPMFRQLIH